MLDRQPAYRFAHILNPVSKPPDHELSIAQRLTYRSIDAARKSYKQGSRRDVQVICAGYEEDYAVFPSFAGKAVLLSRSLRDLTGAADAPKFPVVADILGACAEVVDAEYLIFTNVDIALMPFFYEVVDKLLDGGLESMTINRRCIDASSNELDDLQLLYSNAGKSHVGHDCFVFRKSHLSRIDLGNLCIGLPGFDTVLKLILKYRCTKYADLRDRHLTFHLGDDMNWGSTRMQRWREWNYAQTVAPLKKLREDFGESDEFAPLVEPVYVATSTHRSFFHRAMNKAGRTLVRYWPDQR